MLCYYLKVWNSSSSIIELDIHDVKYLGVFNKHMHVSLSLHRDTELDNFKQSGRSPEVVALFSATISP